MIFNRASIKLYEKEHYGNLQFWGSDEAAWWWGTSENKSPLGKGKLPEGNYVYILQLNDGINQVKTGTLMITY